MIPSEGILPRWGSFLRERFPPVVHAVSVGAFCFGNGVVGIILLGGRPHPVETAVTFLVSLLIFLRLRIFDEMKDFATDRTTHPDRPLARGLISLHEAGIAAVLLALAEGGLAAFLGRAAFLSWALVLGFSLLMFREFFVGNWLRPRMELYAVTHTLVAGWISLFVVCSVANANIWHHHKVATALVLANWGVFNVFEFARKTYGTEEERPGIDSYSRRRGHGGAVLLSMGNVGMACLASSFLLQQMGLPAQAPWMLWVPVGVTAAASGVYLVRSSVACAKLYRGTMSAYIVGHYILLGVLALREMSA